MKIDNSRIVIAELHKVISAETTNYLEFAGVSFGGTHYETEKVEDSLILIKFKSKRNGTVYVPVTEIKNMISYLGVKYASEGFIHNDRRFITTSEGFSNNGKFLKDVQPLYECAGKTSLKDIKDVQERHYGADVTFG